jgi:hypothetical protein
MQVGNTCNNATQIHFIKKDIAFIYRLYNTRPLVHPYDSNAAHLLDCLVFRTIQYYFDFSKFINFATHDSCLHAYQKQKKQEY